MDKRRITLEIDSLKISAQLYLPDGQSPHPTVCVCHGIPAKKPDLKDGGYPQLAERICRKGFAVLIFNFRGTGVSEGNLDMFGWTRDLKAVLNYLYTVPVVDESRLALLGFSGGAAVAIYVASQDGRVSGVATCACPAEFTFLTEGGNPQSLIDHFYSIGAIRDKDFPRSSQEWLNGFHLVSPIKNVAGIAPRPLLLVHGNRDETVDVSHAHRLYDKAGEPRQIVIVDGAGHRLRQNDEAMAVVIDWLESRLR